ncbi:hypothetical protein MPH_12059 [Macrophomina phaseolina MS6]|uniref:Uncharacterized protein n=1 Tax=Macrophomina phaseolina (strain MS6) TaxID=1126212 RepID=K2S293_MACPH|nr:hypothetical protein MPH_12059 [Macrophomina phaseolina MS6]
MAKPAPCRAVGAICRPRRCLTDAVGSASLATMWVFLFDTCYANSPKMSRRFCCTAYDGRAKTVIVRAAAADAASVLSESLYARKAPNYRRRQWRTWMDLVHTTVMPLLGQVLS